MHEVYTIDGRHCAILGVLMKVWTGFLVFLAVGCASGEPVPCASGELGDVDLQAPAGIRQTSMSYELPWDGATRELDLHLWYPTSATTGEPAEYIGIFDDEYSLVDAPFSGEDERCVHPLVVYSHGSQAWAGGGSPLLRQFVSQGWVAIGADHLGNTLVDNLDPRPPIFNLLRTADVSALIDWIDDLGENDPLFGRVDTNRVLVMGHSFGGQTSWLLGGPDFDNTAIDAHCGDVCTPEEREAYRDNPGDSRVVGVVPLAGTVSESFVSEQGFAALQTPVFYMTGSDDFDGRPAFERAAAAADVTWVDLEGACHESFTATELPCEGMSKDDSLAIVATYATAFGARTVLSSEDADLHAILDGEREVDPRAVLTR